MREELAALDADNERVLLAIFATFGIPGSLLDLGCGTGVMVKTAKALGVHAIGVDIDPPQGEGFIRYNLTRSLDLGRVFDMVICLEVAEHLPDWAAPVLCQTITRHTHINGRLIFSAALPNQGGNSHQNEQPPAYWRGLLYEHGKFSFREDLTAKLAVVWTYTAGAAAQWLPSNLQVF